jgi:hypothetical protein
MVGIGTRGIQTPILLEPARRLVPRVPFGIIATLGRYRFLDHNHTQGCRRPALHLREQNSPMKDRKREICTSGTVRDGGGNILIYSAGSAIRC